MKRLDFSTWKGWLQASVCVFKDQVSNVAPSSRGGRSQLLCGAPREALGSKHNGILSWETFEDQDLKRKINPTESRPFINCDQSTQNWGVGRAGFSSLPLPISVTLSKSLNLSGPQFVHLQNEGMEEISGSRCWSVGEMHLIFWEKLWKLSRQSSARFWFVWLECVRNL